MLVDHRRSPGHRAQGSASCRAWSLFECRRLQEVVKPHHGVTAGIAAEAEGLLQRRPQPVFPWTMGGTGLSGAHLEPTWRPEPGRYPRTGVCRKPLQRMGPDLFGAGSARWSKRFKQGDHQRRCCTARSRNLRAPQPSASNGNLAKCRLSHDLFALRMNGSGELSLAAKPPLTQRFMGLTWRGLWLSGSAGPVPGFQVCCMQPYKE